jgi:para-nitrobenzyl esterase
VNFAESVGIKGDGPQALNALRALPAEALLGDLNKSTYAGGPIIDNNIITACPQVMLRRRKGARVPMIIGSTTQDLVAILPPSHDDPLSYFGSNAHRARVAYDPSGKLNSTQMGELIGEDMSMHESARFLARQMTKAGMPVWLYRFGYVAESMRPSQSAALHASELPFLFDSLDSTNYRESVTEDDRAVAKYFNSYIVNFVRSAEPNGQELPTWPKFNPFESELMMFTQGSGPTAQIDPWKIRLDLVEHAAETGCNAR